jgi:hypothetical protein
METVFVDEEEIASDSYIPVHLLPDYSRLLIEMKSIRKKVHQNRHQTNSTNAMLRLICKSLNIPRHHSRRPRSLNQNPQTVSKSKDANKLSSLESHILVPSSPPSEISQFVPEPSTDVSQFFPESSSTKIFDDLNSFDSHILVPNSPVPIYDRNDLSDSSSHLSSTILPSPKIITESLSATDPNFDEPSPNQKEEVSIIPDSPSFQDASPSKKKKKEKKEEKEKEELLFFASRFFI